MEPSENNAQQLSPKLALRISSVIFDKGECRAIDVTFVKVDRKTQSVKVHAEVIARAIPMQSKAGSQKPPQISTPVA